MRVKNRGSGLITLIIALGLLLVVLFAMAEASMFHLTFAAGLDSRQQARNLAESAVNEALAEVLNAENYGEAKTETVKVDGEGDPNRNFGLVTFNPADSRAPHSLNNLKSLNQVAGSTRAVPGNTVHLVGKGYAGGTVHTVEAIFYRPPFPKALCATGPIHARGTTVAGIAANATYPGSPGGIPSGSRMPGSLQTNSALRGAQPALKLEQCNVSGDAAAAGDVNVDSATTIGGEVRANGSPQPIPHIDVMRRINDIKDAQGTQILSGSSGDLTVDWFSGCRDPQFTINGDLNLKNGVLWTLGDLTITGGIKGQGLVLCGGKVKVLKGSRLDAENMVALAAQGDVLLDGQGQSSYYFQGLVYTKGDFEAQDLTVLGAVIADSTDPQKGGLKLQNVNLVQSPTSVQSNFGKMLAIRTTGTGGRAGGTMPVEVTPSTSGVTDWRITIAPTIESIDNRDPSRPVRYNISFHNASTGFHRSLTNLTGGLIDLGGGRTAGEFGVQNYIRAESLSDPKKQPPPSWPRDSYTPQPATGWPGPKFPDFWTGLKDSGGSQSNVENDLVQQVDEISRKSPQELQALMLLPTINSLMAPGERSRMLLWRSY